MRYLSWLRKVKKCYLSCPMKLKKCFLSWLMKLKMRCLSWLMKLKKRYLSWLRKEGTGLEMLPELAHETKKELSELTQEIKKNTT